MIRILKAGFSYFAIVFGAGFLLGTMRTLWIVPRVGARTAELMETPVMLAISVFAARWVVRRFALRVRSGQLTAGIMALGLLLLAEFSFVLRLRGLSIREYGATLDPVAGTVYYASLIIFAVMPVLVASKSPRATSATPRSL